SDLPCHLYSTNAIDTRRTMRIIVARCRFCATQTTFKQQSENIMNITYLTTAELSSRIKYDARTIREKLKDSVLIEGRHYFQPFGGRKILYIWEHIEEDMLKHISRTTTSHVIPMANGGVCHG